MNYSKIGTHTLIYLLVKSIFVALLMTILIGGIIGIATSQLALSLIGTFILLMILFVLKDLLLFNSLGYKIESNSLSLKKGLLSIKTETIPFSKVINVSFEQSLLQRLFSVGDILIAQDDNQYKWDGIDKMTADKVVEEISSKSNIQPISKN